MIVSSDARIPNIADQDEKKKIAFVYSLPSSSLIPSFIEQDFEILSKYYNCYLINFKGLNDFARMLKYLHRSDICFSWFASGHSFIAVAISKLLLKKSIVVVGGYDVAGSPEIDYGQYTLGLMKRMRANFVLKHVDLALAVSNFTKQEAMARTKLKRIIILYNAVDIEKFHPARTNEKREEMVITIASGLGDVIKLKGLDVFLKAAELLPNVEFIILGLTNENMLALQKMISSGNVKLYGYMSQEELLNYYQKAKVYCQLSYRESFGLATAEAMACGCVPVITDRGALPEVVGDVGFYVSYGDEVATAEGIKKALKSKNGALARKRIEEKFSIQKREKDLLGLIETL